MPIADGAPKETLLTIVPNKANVIFKIDTIYNLDNTVHLILVVENTDMTTFPLNGLHSIELQNAAYLGTQKFETLSLNNTDIGKYTCTYDGNLKKLTMHYEQLYDHSPQLSTLPAYKMYNVILNFKNENYLPEIPTTEPDELYITVETVVDNTINAGILNWGCIDRGMFAPPSYKFITESSYGTYWGNIQINLKVSFAGIMFFPQQGQNLLQLQLNVEGTGKVQGEDDIVEFKVNNNSFPIDELYYIVPNTDESPYVGYAQKCDLLLSAESYKDLVILIKHVEYPPS